MSFSLTTAHVHARTKDVTRRVGWATLRPGEQLQPVIRSQGLKKGEHVEKIGGPIEVVSVRREPLSRLLTEPYGSQEVAREGFGDTTPQRFVEFFCETHHCRPDDEVTRIEFRYVEPA